MELYYIIFAFMLDLLKIDDWVFEVNSVMIVGNLGKLWIPTFLTGFIEWGDIYFGRKYAFRTSQLSILTLDVLFAGQKLVFCRDPQRLLKGSPWKYRYFTCATLWGTQNEHVFYRREWERPLRPHNLKIDPLHTLIREIRWSCDF